jgi:hypothetical protein
MLDNQGRFSVNKSSADSGTTQPTHKFCFPMFDDTGDLLVWMHKASLSA